MKRRSLLAAAGLASLGMITHTSPRAHAQAEWQSDLVSIDDNGHLTYSSPDGVNIIPDYSHAGYAGASRPIPSIPTRIVVSPVTGDNTAHLQAAIDNVGARPLVGGIRGAVCLRPGTYEVSGTLRIAHTGVVLRGSGSGPDPEDNTIIKATGNTPSRRTVIVIGAGNPPTRWNGWADEVPGSRTDITTDFVRVGDRKFTVADSSLYAIGDNVIVQHPSTQAWLDAIDGGGTDTDPPWSPVSPELPLGSVPLVFNRRISSIDGAQITLDAPVYDHLNRSLAQSQIYKLGRTDLRTNIGLERLRVDIDYAGDPATDVDHAWTAISLENVEDAWVRDCVALHFTKTAFRTTGANRITIDACKAIDPVGPRSGTYRYNFCTDHYSQQILFSNCYAKAARHAYISNGASSASGIVFTNCTAEASTHTDGAHRLWSQGLLYDQIVHINPIFEAPIGMYNGGSTGTSHGWHETHSVAWNCDVAGKKIRCQKPPTGMNYAIGCLGDVSNDGPFVQPPGYIEGTNQVSLEPASLYHAQLMDRQ